MTSLYADLKTTLTEAGFRSKMVERCVTFARTHAIQPLGLPFHLGWIVVSLAFSVVGGAVLNWVILRLGLPQLATALIFAPLLVMGVLAIRRVLGPKPSPSVVRIETQAKAVHHIIRLAFATRHDPSGQAMAMLENFAKRLNTVDEAAQLDELITALDL